MHLLIQSVDDIHLDAYSMQVAQKKLCLRELTSRGFHSFLPFTLSGIKSQPPVPLSIVYGFPRIF